MFKATRAFKDTVTSHPKEPSLRIGKCVPENAVNLAYYYNPTATDAEKILTAEAPRNTIDHRVEEAYRYLFNQASEDDDLFPGSVLYEDEEGYQGRLGRMYVNWYPEAHILTKNVQQTKDVIVIEKSEIPKMFEYSDDNGYSGNLYLDAAEFEVTKTKDETYVDILDREILNHELNYHEIFDDYINPNNINTWMEEPTSTSDSMWPKEIIVDYRSLKVSGGNKSVRNFIESMDNPYDGAMGVLKFDSIEYEQVYRGGAESGEVKDYEINGTFNNKDEKAPIDSVTVQDGFDLFGQLYKSEYDATEDKYNYDNIEEFLKMAEKYHENTDEQDFVRIRNAIENNKDITIYMSGLSIVAEDHTNENTDAWYSAKYKYVISSRGSEGKYQYNAVANYIGMLKKTVTTIKEVPAEYKATCKYTGLARKVWYDYDGVAYYRGAVTKGNGVGNVNPEGDNEILMFSDDEGYLRRPIEVTDENGEVTIKNFYRIESDYIYLTDVFKDGVACFYKYLLKLPIYDYRGPDDNGFYEGDAVKIFTSGLKDMPEEYKDNMKLKEEKYPIYT